MTPLLPLAAVELDQWPTLYRLAVAAGAGSPLCRVQERLAAPDELVALALPGLVGLGAVTLVADAAEDLPPEYATALARNAARVLRLLDRALAAHGRDHGYAVGAWRELAFRAAHGIAHTLAHLEAEEMPLSVAVRDAAYAVAAVVMALHRDRLGVPEELAHALGSVVVVYAAAAGEAG